MTTSSDVSGSSIYNPITSFARVRSRKKTGGLFFPLLLHLSFLQLSDGSISLHKTIYWQTVKCDRGLHQTHTKKKTNSDDIFQMSFISLDFGSRFYGGVMGSSQTYQLVVCLFTSLVFPPCPEKFTEAVENGLKR